MSTTLSRAAWREARAALRWVVRSLWRPADADSGWEQAPGREPPPTSDGGHRRSGSNAGSAEPSATRGTAQSH